MSLPVISVIIPIYNTPQGALRQCLDCLAAQTFENYECVIVDDGSTVEIARYLDAAREENSRIRVLHTPNRGVSAARNLGIKESVGELLCFIDADDYYAPWLLEDLYGAYLKAGDVQSVCAYFYITADADYAFQRTGLDIEVIPSIQMGVAALVGTICGETNLGFLSPGICSVLVQSKYAKKNPFDVEIKYMEDTIWNLQHFLAGGKTAILKETVYVYRENALSATHTYRPSIVPNRIAALERLAEVTPPHLREWLGLRALANYYICCKCVIWSSDSGGFSERVSQIRELSRKPIWRLFKQRGISRKWPIKQKCKRWLALSGAVPFLLMKKGVFQ